MWEVMSEGTTIGIVHISLALPPPLPNRQIEIISRELATFRASTIEGELPPADMPKKMSPFCPSPSSWREKIKSKLASLAQAVIIEVSVVRAIAGKGFLILLYLPRSSTEKCWDSAAAPPTPAIYMH